MSISTRDPLNKEAQKRLNELFGEPVARDDFTALYDKMQTLNRQSMKEMANAAGQPVTVELNDTGEGWKRGHG